MSFYNKKFYKNNEAQICYEFYLNWDSVYARQNSYYEALSYEKKKHKKMEAYRKSV